MTLNLDRQSDKEVINMQELNREHCVTTAAG